MAVCLRACVCVRGFRYARKHTYTHARTPTHTRAFTYIQDICVNVRASLCGCGYAGMLRCSTHHRASPLAKQTRYGFSFSVSTAIAKPCPWRQCFVRLEGRNASGTPLPSIHASSFPASDASPADSSSPSAWAAFGLQSSRIANTTPLAA